MARVSNSSKLKELQGQLSSSQEWRNREQHDQLWKRMVNLYKGRHYTNKSKADRAVVNQAFATKNVISPSVAVNNPKFTVNARKPESAAQAVITETVLNYIWRTYKYQREFRLAVDDMLVVGHGWLKVGYKATKPPEGKVADEHADPDDASSEGIDDRDETIEGNIESEMYVPWDEDRPFVERVSFFDMFVDPHARHPKEMKWVAQRTRRLVSDVRVDSRYDKTARERANGRTHSNFDDSKDGRDDREIQSQAKPGAYCDVIEFYDLRRQEVSTFLMNDATDGSFLIKPKRIPYPFGHPFVMLRNYEVTDHFYPIGELEAIEVLQLELNATRTQMLNHRSKFARKYLYHADSYDETGLLALRSDEDNEMVPFQGDIQDMSNSVVAMPVQGTPPDFYNQSELIQADIDRISGVSDYMRGATANIRRTATEAAMIQDAQNARAADKLSNVEGALAEIGERLITLMQMYMTGEHVIRIVGISHPTWVKFDADYLQGEFDFEVEAGSTQPMNETFRQQQALQLVEAVGGLMSLGASIDPNRVALHVIRAFGIKDPDSYVAQQEMGMEDEGMEGEEMPPEEGMPPAGPPPGGAMPAAEFEPEQQINGIPQELVNQLVSKSGLAPRNG
jgi:hypothetical protein